MVKKRLNQYKGSLNSSQIAAGINSALLNSKRLVEDSILLFNEERYPSAVSLAILSIEEAGKVSILRELALYSDEKKLKKK